MTRTLSGRYQEDLISNKVILLSSSRAKYFRGRKIHTDWDIRVEQVEFKDLTVSASSMTGVSAGILSYKSGNRSTK